MVKDNLLTKYKPKTLDELPLPSNLIKTLKEICEFKGGVYIFHSPPGTGKSTACEIIMKEAIKKLGRRNVLYPPINGSLENTVDVVVNKIQPFANKAGKRLIVIEEADKLTKETGKGKGAQEALKDLTSKTMSRVTWIFVTNHIEDIIQPLIDRAVIVEFKPDKYKMLEVLKRINEKEKLGYTINELKAIVESTYPSIRNAILKLSGIEIKQFDESTLLKDVKQVVEGKLKPRVFIERYKGLGVNPIIRYLTEKGDKYFGEDTYVKILILLSYISELKDTNLALVTLAYLLHKLNDDNWCEVIDEILTTTITLKAISTKFYTKLMSKSNKKR